MDKVFYATLFIHTIMLLRWMVRRDENGVDFGLWRIIPPAAAAYCSFLLFISCLGS